MSGAADPRYTWAAHPESRAGAGGKVWWFATIRDELADPEHWKLTDHAGMIIGEVWVTGSGEYEASIRGAHVPGTGPHRVVQCLGHFINADCAMTAVERHTR